MTLKERVRREEGNHDSMIVYADGGLFYNLYERSAYAFCTRIKSFKVNVKTIQGLDAPFVSIGVPVNRKEEYLPDLAADPDDEKCFRIRLKDPVDEESFIKWKNLAVSNDEEIRRLRHVKRRGVPEPDNTDYTTVRHCIIEIKGLNMASMTPMDAMNFLHTMQERLKDINV